MRNPMKIMFTIILLLTISIGSLTLFSLRTKSPNEAEIKITLNFMSSNCKALLKNIKTLLLLLLKDLTQDSSKTTLIDLQGSAEINKSSNLQEISIEEDNLLEEIDEDPEISKFSEEVIQLIEEEENKAA